MAHNFKLTGDYYVSVDGSDSNDGLTPDTPKRTIQAGLNLITTSNRTLIIGAGVYQESISKSFLGILGAVINADGVVILKSINANTIFITVGGQGSNGTTINGIIFKNYLNISGGSNNGASGWFTNCTFDNVSININPGSSGYVDYTSCVFTNSNLNLNNSNTPNRVTKSLLFNSFFILPALSTFLNNYVKYSQLSTNLSSVDFNYNNIQDSVIIRNTASVVTSGVIQDTYGRYYDLSIATSTGSGTIGDPFGRPLTAGAGFDFATHRILYSTFNVNSFSLDPKFNDIEAQDFTLQADSPHLGRASDSTNIGGTSYALRYAALGNTFNTNATVVDLEQRGEDWIVDLPATSGSVVSAPIFVNNVPKVLQTIRYNGRLEFNKAVTPPSDGNNINVPDNFTYESTTQPPDVAGANPDRLVYEMRFSTQVAEPTTSGEWDNDGLWTAGNYGVFEWNTKPSVDTGGIGNGNPTFNVADTPTFLQATWIQLRIILRNDYGA
jgi:hypothetical protein